MRGKFAVGSAALAALLPAFASGAAIKEEKRSELLKRQQLDASCVQDQTLADLSASPEFEPFCSAFLGIGPTTSTIVVTPTVTIFPTTTITRVHTVPTTTTTTTNQVMETNDFDKRAAQITAVGNLQRRQDPSVVVALSGSISNDQLRAQTLSSACSCIPISQVAIYVTSTQIEDPIITSLNNIQYRDQFSTATFIKVKTSTSTEIETFKAVATPILTTTPSPPSASSEICPGATAYAGEYPYTVSCDTDYPNNDIVRGTADDTSECIDACDEYNARNSTTVQCNVAVFVPDMQACYLKNFPVNNGVVSVPAPFIATYKTNAAVRQLSPTSAKKDTDNGNSTSTADIESTTISRDGASSWEWSSTVPDQTWSTTWGSSWSDSTETATATGAGAAGASGSANGATGADGAGATGSANGTTSTAITTSFSCPADNGTTSSVIQNGYKEDFVNLCDTDYPDDNSTTAVHRANHMECLSSCANANTAGTVMCSAATFDEGSSGDNCVYHGRSDWRGEARAGYTTVLLLTSSVLIENGTSAGNATNGGDGAAASSSAVESPPPDVTSPASVDSSNRTAWTTDYGSYSTSYSASHTTIVVSRTTQIIVDTTSTIIDVEGGGGGGFSGGAGGAATSTSTSTSSSSATTSTASRTSSSGGSGGGAGGGNNGTIIGGGGMYPTNTTGLPTSTTVVTVTSPTSPLSITYTGPGRSGTQTPPFTTPALNTTSKPSLPASYPLTTPTFPTNATTAGGLNSTTTTATTPDFNVPPRNGTQIPSTTTPKLPSSYIPPATPFSPTYTGPGRNGSQFPPTSTLKLPTQYTYPNGTGPVTLRGTGLTTGVSPSTTPLSPIYTGPGRNGSQTPPPTLTPSYTYPNGSLPVTLPGTGLTTGPLITPTPTFDGPGRNGSQTPSTLPLPPKYTFPNGNWTSPPTGTGTGTAPPTSPPFTPSFPGGDRTGTCACTPPPTPITVTSIAQPTCSVSTTTVTTCITETVSAPCTTNPPYGGAPPFEQWTTEPTPTMRKRQPSPFGRPETPARPIMV